MTKKIRVYEIARDAGMESHEVRDTLRLLGYEAPSIATGLHLAPIEHEALLAHLIDDGQSPRYEHDCDKCEFMGRFERFDLYYCATEGETVIARFGVDGDYYSGFGHERVPSLVEAERRLNVMHPVVEPEWNSVDLALDECPWWDMPVSKRPTHMVKDCAGRMMESRVGTVRVALCEEHLNAGIDEGRSVTASQIDRTMRLYRESIDLDDE